MRHMGIMFLSVLILVAGAIVGCGGEAWAQLPAIADSAAAWRNPDEELRLELLALMEADQAIRHELIAVGMENASDSLLAAMDVIDSTNTARIKEIIETRGWPGKDLVGEDGAEAAFLLVQHADRDLGFQKEMLLLLQLAFLSGKATGEQYALLTDRVRRAEGHPQVFGTQAWVEDGKLVVAPIEDEAGVDARRAELGMVPLADYIRILKETYGIQDESP